MTDTSNITPTVKTFGDFGVAAPICEALTDAGITSPFPIQELTLPLALGGADLIGQARTGTGKTLAFGIPLIQRIDPAAPRKTQALVIVPTRELCVQVREDLAQASAKLDVSVVAVYGGKAIEAQIAALEKGAQIVVGTPGRLLDLLRRGVLQLGAATGLVLDEADEMLDLGFLPDVEQLIQATAEQRQTLLFSATMPAAVVALARRYMHKPTFLRADVEEVRIGPKTAQHFFSCHRMDKPAVLARILSTPERGLCVVFTRTKRMADVLAEELRGRGIDAAPIHSDLRQDARERTLDRFRAGTLSVLVATEVAARGLDIDDVTHVVNYDCPEDEKMYLHRIGRTGRAGAAGVAVTLAVWSELARLEMIKKALEIDVPTHEVFSTSPILDELFDLPPREERPKRVSEPTGDRPPGGKRGKRPSEADAPRGGRREPAVSRSGDAEQPKTAAVAETADAQRAATRDEDGQREDGARRGSRRGGRGRGRGRGGEKAGATTREDGAPQPSREPGRESSRESSPEPSRAASGQDAGDEAVRVRRRVRRVAGESAAADDSGKPSESSQSRESADRGAASPRRTETATPAGDEPVRVRRRVRVDPAEGGQRTGNERAASPARDRDRGAGRPSGSGGRGQAGEPRRSTRGERPAAAAADEPKGESGRRENGRGESGRSSSGRGDRRRGSRDTARRGDDERRPSRARPQIVGSDEARGAGKPALNRPLRIAHLP